MKMKLLKRWRPGVSSLETDVAAKIEDIMLKVDTALASVNGGNTQCTPSTAECLDEVEDRLSRLPNVILLGIPESNQADAVHRKADDTKAVTVVCSAAGVTENEESLRCFRLGKYSPNLTLPRPIKAILSSATNANVLVQRHRRVKMSNVQLKNISVFPDQTARQRMNSKALKEELVKRKKDEANPFLKIVYFNGVGKIVSAPPRPDQRPKPPK